MGIEPRTPSIPAQSHTRPKWQRLLTAYLDLYVVAAAAPVALLTGAPAAGYAIGTATWLLWRAVAVAVDLRAMDVNNVVEQAALRLSYRLVRVGLIAGATLIAQEAAGTESGLTALLVIAVAFTFRLQASAVDRWLAHSANR